jgi:hypothetical protein
MMLNASVYDIWVYRRTAEGVLYLVLHTSREKADRYFSGGRFWQIPSGVFRSDESVAQTFDRELASYGLTIREIWAGEHAYIIYNRRFDEMQVIGVYAAEVGDVPVRLEPTEHSEYGWFHFETCIARVHYRGLKDGVRSVDEYVTGVQNPARELCLYIGEDV